MGCDLELAGQILNIHSVYALVSLTAYPVFSWQCCQISWIHTEYLLSVHIGQPDSLSNIVLDVI
jgi:hypothetical protein